MTALRGLREAARDSVRTLDPGCFAFVMATGIVSVALLRAGQRPASVVLLVIALTALAVLLAASAWRAAAFPAALRADLLIPARTFAFFTLVAALGVVGVRLALSGQPAATAVLAALAAAAWLALSYLMPIGLAARRARPDDINGTWFLWAVGTESLALLAISLSGPDGLARSPAWSDALTFTAVALWSCGAILYLVILVLVLGRVLIWRLRPGDATPPYWIAMGAAAITVLAGARLLQSPATPVLILVRPLLAGLALALWAFASWLIPLLAALMIWRHITCRTPLRYHGDLWAAIFPAGMYAAASMRLGLATGVPAITWIGRGATWVAAAAWLVTFTALLLTAAGSRPGRGHREPGISPGTPLGRDDDAAGGRAG